MSHKALSILNLIVTLFFIAWNGISQTGMIYDQNIGDLSAKYDNLFTPASYAFSIWGLIFLMLLAYSIYQVKHAFRIGVGRSKVTPSPTSASADPGTSLPSPRLQEFDFIKATGLWYAIGTFICGAWIHFWLTEQLIGSLVCMFATLVCLLVIVIKTRMELDDRSMGIIAFVWWPICIFSGWITVASIANMSAVLDAYGFSWGYTETTWTLIMIVVAVAVNILMITQRNMREFAAVGMWALFAIYLRHANGNESVAQWALGGTMVLLVIAGLHAYRNRATLPHVKLKQRFADN